MAYVLGYLEHLEYAESAAIARAAASFAFAWLKNSFANLETDRAVSRICGKVGWRKLPLGLASIAQLTHKPLGDNGAQR